MEFLGFKKSALALACLATSVGASADLYFSEYVEGSSNNKALEIYNSSNSPVNLSGYKVEMYFNGSNSAGLTINLSGSVPAQGTFVLAHASATGTIITSANQTNAAGWYNGDDAILLKNGSIIIDSIGQVGVDPGIEWGTGLTSTADNTLRRKASVTSGKTSANLAFDPSVEWDGFATDTFDNLGTYQGSSNNGNGNGNGGNQSSSCGAASTLISAIQGSGSASPLVGSGVSVEAIVVASFQGSGQIGGFFLQEPDNLDDNNPATSEGIYVTSTTPVSVGDKVRVSGSVAETFNLTQITPTSVSVCASNQTLPIVTGIALPLATLTDFEAVEGMLVTAPQTLTVNETYGLGRYGQVLLADGRLSQPTNLVSPGAAAIAQQTQNNLNKLMLDDSSNLQNPDPVIFPAPGLSAANPLRSGDTVTGLTGVMTYDFGAYRLLPTVTPNFVKTNARPTAPKMAANANLKVASFNVLNFFNGNGLGGGFPTARGANTATEFARQKAKIVNALVGLNADVIGLLELENDGYDTYSAIAELTAALNTATSTNQWTYINPGLSKVGTDEIAVGIIYRKDRATAIGQTAILDSSVEPLFIDNKNRPTLAQSFRATQGRGVITIAINHLKSKGSDCNDLGDLDTGDGQGNCNITRTNAAQALVNWLSRKPTGVNDGDFLIIGDLNSYAKEEPITKIINAGYTDLINKFGSANAYSYVFDGQAGYLDHGLATKSLTAQVLEAADWHINADEPISLDYNTEFKSAAQINSFYANDAYRSSDHDPLVISLKLIIDLDGDGDVDSDDIKIVTNALNTTASPLDQRDVNGDGIINANDARALTLQCTRTACATK
ncbi:extracelullar DNA degradation protein EddB [Cellvibrio zantedeschiae]|uniref:Extracelullar DNA degradation protein EddB n=1 Tax=Cellvibrio zantedeschiae TaxID=1237077 RepID=A0ABQ3B5C2_9GAMM|nr:ExeM/NucH family extracellular endonuclease [Cellvibrio zantedeschiae]GGY80413.1 extracelullar DNA degradation protein EddB [Cellvibrio zantedeschiae]